MGGIIHRPGQPVPYAGLFKDGPLKFGERCIDIWSKLRGVPVKGVALLPTGRVQSVDRCVGGNLVGGKDRPVAACITLNLAIKLHRAIRIRDCHSAVKNSRVWSGTVLQTLKLGGSVWRYQLLKKYRVGIANVVKLRGDAGGIRNARKLPTGIN